MSGIDYSKWEKLEVSSSDEESNKPRISQFDTPKSISFGQNKDWKIQKSSRKDEKQEALNAHSFTETADSKGHNYKKSIPSFYIQNGGVHFPKYFWNQTLRNVTVYIPIDLDISGKNVSILIQEKTLNVEHIKTEDQKVTKEVILTGEFPYPVEETEEHWYWEVIHLPFPWNALLKDTFPKPNHELKRDSNLKVIRIELVKKSLFADSFVWWDCFQKGDTKIDVTQIPDRLKPKSLPVNESTTDHAKANYTKFREVWDAAHSQFREKSRTYQKINISDFQDDSINQAHADEV